MLHTELGVNLERDSSCVVDLETVTTVLRVLI